MPFVDPVNECEIERGRYLRHFVSLEMLPPLESLPTTFQSANLICRLPQARVGTDAVLDVPPVLADVASIRPLDICGPGLKWKRYILAGSPG